MLALQEPVNEVDSGLYGLWKQSELNLNYYKPVYKNFPVLCGQLWLPFKVASERIGLELALEKVLMYGPDIVALD